MMKLDVRQWFVVLYLCLFAGGVHANDTEYRMGTGDVVRITVYSQADLTTDARIDEQGEIAFPLIGQVKLGGVTPGAGGKEIARRLKEGGFLVKPHVNLNVIQYRSQQVSVLGRVNRPGKITLEKVSRISDVLALAGGVTGDASDMIKVVRQRNDRIEFFDIDLLTLFQPSGHKFNFVVNDGDIINVDKQDVFYIYGEVQRPGMYRLDRDVLLVQALSQGGGVNQRGTQRGIKILRRNASGVLDELPGNLGDKVLPDDVIYVKESLF